MTNTWPNDVKKAMTQCEHEKWNSYNYPGTKQVCSECEEPTGNCEEDTLINEETGGYLCYPCYLRREKLLE